MATDCNIHENVLPKHANACRDCQRACAAVAVEEPHVTSLFARWSKMCHCINIHAEDVAPAALD